MSENEGLAFSLPPSPRPPPSPLPPPMTCRGECVDFRLWQGVTGLFMVKF